MTPERQGLWAEVQHAYAWGDVHRMQKLHVAVCGEGAAPGISLDFATMPIGDIIGLRKPVERRLREARSKLRDAKREIYWGFALLREKGGKALAKVRAVVARDLGEDLADALGHKARLERLVASWEQGAHKQSRGGGRGPGRKKQSNTGRRRRDGHYHDSWMFD